MKKSIVQLTNEAALAKWEAIRGRRANERALRQRATPINREAKLLAYALAKQRKQY